MYITMRPNNHFTDVNVSTIKQAKTAHLDVLLAQVVLDADIDVLCSIDAHVDAKGLAVLSEWHALQANCDLMRQKFYHVMQCAMAVYLRKVGV